MAFNAEIGGRMAIYAAILGILYIAFGVLEVTLVFPGVKQILTNVIIDGITGLYEHKEMMVRQIVWQFFNWIPADFFGGLVSLVIASTYITSIKGLRTGDFRGLSLLVGGLFLSVVFGVLYLLLMFADALNFVIGEAEEFSALADLRPEIWLLVVAIPLAYQTWSMLKEVPW